MQKFFNLLRLKINQKTSKTKYLNRQVKKNAHTKDKEQDII